MDYRIRQHTELHNQIKKNKGAVTFEDIVPTTTTPTTGAASTCVGDVSDQMEQQSINGYRGILPGNTKASDIDETINGGSTNNGAYDTASQHGSCRTRAFQRSEFRKRKLLQTNNLHTISKKAARQR